MMIIYAFVLKTITKENHLLYELHDISYILLSLTKTKTKTSEKSKLLA